MQDRKRHWHFGKANVISRRFRYDVKRNEERNPVHALVLRYYAVDTLLIAIQPRIRLLITFEIALKEDVEKLNPRADDEERGSDVPKCRYVCMYRYCYQQCRVR